MLTLIQTCIGLALLYFLSSLLVSAIIEYLAAMVKLRSRLLKQALDRMVGNADVVLKYGPVQATTPPKESLNPLGKALSSISNLFYRSAATPAYIHPTLFASALLKGTTQTDQSGMLKDALAQSPGVQLAQQSGAAQGAVALQQEIEQWYVEAMKRWEGVYTRWTQTISLLICLVLVPLMNVNTVTVANYLWVTPQARAEIAEKAGQVINDTNMKQMHQSEATRSSASQSTLPEENSEGSSTAKDATTVVVATKARDEAHKAITDLHLPLGWEKLKTCPASQDIQKCVPQEDKDHAGFTWEKFTYNFVPSLLGWLLSIIAISAGSRFWFDVLNRLVNLRLTGPPPTP